MGTITRFEDIEAWQTGRALTRRIYELSNGGTFARDFGLRDQMRRAAVSILSNVAEGFESETRAQFIRYLGLAKASAGEFRAQLYVALDAGHLEQHQFDDLYNQAEKCSRQPYRFIAYLKSHPTSARIREESVEYDIATF